MISKAWETSTFGAQGHFDHNNFQEHLWQVWELKSIEQLVIFGEKNTWSLPCAQCGLQVAQRWAGVPNQELIKQAEAPEVLDFLLLSFQQVDERGKKRRKFD